MAKQAENLKTLQKLEQEITCPVCYDHFEDPRILPCSHYYCKQCVQALADRAGPNRPFSCPECRCDTRLPQNDPNQLPKALSVIRMKDLHSEQLKEKERAHQTTCPKHNDPLKLFCFTCNHLICGQCAAFDHQKHTFKVVSEVTPQYRELVRKQMAPLKAAHKSYSDATDRAKATISDIEAQNTSTAAAITQWVEGYVEIIRSCGHTFIENISSTSAQKIDRLKIQVEEFDDTRYVIQSVGKFCEKKLGNATDEEFMELHKQILSRVEDECKKHKDTNLELAEECTTFRWTEGLAELCQKKIPIVASLQLDNAASLTLGKRAAMSLSVLTADGTPCKKALALEGELNSLVDGSLVRIKGTQKKEGVYEMVYTPRIRGRHQLAVTVNGEQVAGSPFTVCVKIPPTQLGTPVRVISGLNSPYGVAFNSAGEVLVTMTGEVGVFDKQGKKRKSIKPFQRLRGISVDKEDNIFVSDRDRGCIYKLDKDGNPLKVIGRVGGGNGEFNCPMGVAVIGEHVFVCDRDNHRIQILTRELKFVKVIGTCGTRNGQFQRVFDISQDEAGNLYVCDCSNDRIQILNSKGDFLDSFGTKGKGKGQLSGPSGVCVSDQLVYVSEWGNDRMSVFDTSGHFVAFFGNVRAEGCLNRPFIVSVDRDGFIYVCDYGNNRVIIF